jgi:hypothetical protein
MDTARLSLRISINGVYLPLEHVTLVKLLLCSSVNQIVPVCELLLTDTMGIMKNQITLTDGVPIIVTVGTAKNRTTTYDFRLFRYVESESDTGIAYKIVMYFDNAMYWQGTTTKSFKGTSEDAIKHIADACNVEVYTDTTADSMVWLPMNDRWSKWSRRIAQAGYFDDTSGFILGMQLNGSLVYKNVAAYKYTDSLPLFVTGGAGLAQGIPIMSQKPLTTSGYQNLSGGYHQSHMAHDLTSDTDIGERHDKVSKVRATQDLSMNGEVKGQLSGGKVISVAPIDSGNTHPNYQKAMYQNARLLKLNSNHLALITTELTELDLLDQVRVQVYEMSINGTPKLNLNSSGYYYISGKSIYVGPQGFYVERFNLSRDGHNLDPQNAQGDV